MESVFFKVSTRLGGEIRSMAITVKMVVSTVFVLLDDVVHVFCGLVFFCNLFILSPTLISAET